MMPTVSIVIPTHKRPKMVGDAVRSALQQSYTQIEVLVVVGGRQPQTVAVLNVIQDDYLRALSCATPKNPAAARNIVIENADGQYIVFLDDDNCLFEHAVERLVKIPQEQSPEYVGIYPARIEEYSPTNREKYRSLNRE